MRYVLRFCLQPGFHEKEKLDALVRYVERARIDEVMFFINCEELFEGNLSIEENAPWMRTIQEGAAALKAVGCDFSLNPWTTLGHADRGRQRPAGWDYQVMVAPDGQKSQVVPCPCDENFIEYLGDLYAHFATYSPTVLWLEDDFRLHNHAPLPWGGCFCPNHMKMFSEKLGFEVTREEFVRKAFAAGDTNPYRQAWLESARETMRSLAQRIGAKVRAANPRVALGLMSSAPSVHCCEYRDWQGIFEGIRTGVPAHSRPHLPAYSDVAPVQYLARFPGITARTVDTLPPGTPVFPELENAPYSRFSKSDAMAGLQMELALSVGISGMTMNLFDMFGNGIDEADTFWRYLSGRKPYLSAVTSLGLGKGRHRGVSALYGDGSSTTLRVETDGNTPLALRPEEDSLSGMLTAMGVSVLPRETSRPGNDNVMAVCGQYLRNLTDAEIRALFEKNRLLLDGESVCILAERGLGALAGASAARLLPDGSGLNSYEQACEGTRYAGFSEGRVSAQNSAGDWVDIQYNDSVEILSTMRNMHGQITGAGMALFGNVLILPYRMGARLGSHMTRVRQQMLQRVLAGWGVPMALDCVAAALYAYDVGFLLVNGSMDSAEGARVCWPEKAGTPVLEITGDGTQSPVGSLNEKGEWALPGALPALSSRAFVFKAQ